MVSFRPGDDADFGNSFRIDGGSMGIEAEKRGLLQRQSEEGRLGHLQARLDGYRHGNVHAHGVEMARVVGIVGPRHDHHVGPERARDLDHVIDGFRVDGDDDARASSMPQRRRH